jgi:tRNA A37 threonylcarbamoyltransferase TsaD
MSTTWLCCGNDKSVLSIEKSQSEFPQREWGSCGNSYSSIRKAVLCCRSRSIKSIVDVLVENTFAAAQTHGVKKVLVAGGVAANSALQSAVRSRGRKLGIAVSIPPPVLCTDNAAMAAAAAYFRYQRGELTRLDMDCFASEPLGHRPMSEIRGRRSEGTGQSPTP